jgi:ferredoxin
MMMDKNDLRALANAVKDGGASFFAPAMRDGMVTLVEPLPGDDIILDSGNTNLPLKRFLFPWSETLYTYDNGAIEESVLPDTQVVVLGGKPCDAHSLEHLDRVFLDECIVDPYYLRRKNNAMIISVACSIPRSTCFCTSVKGGPSDTRGSDMIVHVLKDMLLFESCSEKGGEFLAEHSGFMSEPGAEHIAERDRQVDAALKGMPPFDLKDIEKKLGGCFDSPVWKEISASCLGCGACTYLCPTCHCFVLHDENRFERGKRIRVQDSCMYPSFTAEASGHNPRMAKGDRVRQRVMHKFRYTMENLGEIFCVGCGRCIVDCPVNIDVRETLARVMK